MSDDTVRWVGGLVRGDFGRSLASGLPVGDLLRDRVFDTLVLTVPATLLAWSVALVWVGRLARTPGRVVRGMSEASLAVGQSVPDVVLGLALVRIALETGWWPVGGQGDWERASGLAAWIELVRHAALPVFGLTMLMLPTLVRHLHAAVEEAGRAPFVRAAVARGLTPGHLYWRHELPIALTTLTPLLGFSLAALLGGALVLEVVFAWPGVGPLLVDAVLARDVPVVLGVVCASATLLVVSHAVSDVLQYAADPRQRT